MKRLDAWARWQRAAGPWRGWAVCPLLSMPDVAAPARRDATSGTISLETMEAALAQGDTALVLDLEPTLGVRVAAQISQRRLAHVVLVLPRWPHPQAVLPPQALLAALLRTAEQLTGQDVQNSNVVFVLDGVRQRSVERATNDARVDNRYTLSPHDLPNLATLRAAGVRRLVKVMSST